MRGALSQFPLFRIEENLCKSGPRESADNNFSASSVSSPAIKPGKKHRTITQRTRTYMSAPEKHPVKTRILISEEHPLLRYGVAHFLNSQPDMIVCDETDNIRDARHKIHECKPQLLLTALRLGTGDSLEFVKALKSERPAWLILVYSAFEETIFAERALRAGADGGTGDCNSRNCERQHLCQPRRGDARIQKIAGIATRTSLSASCHWH
jgi:CheY-like chemotaxis protein